MTRAFFYDTWAFEALANRADPAHALAAEVDDRLQRQGFVAVTSDYVLDETLTLLNVAAGARVSIAFLDGLLDRAAGFDLQLVEVGALRRERAFEVFRKLAPAEPRLSFTDASSFAVMHELEIHLAFTADRHFHRAGRGIRPLLERRGSRLIAAGP